MFSPDQAGDVHVPQEDSVSASFASEPERNQTGPPKNTDGTEHLSFRAVSENGAPERGRGGVLSLDHENGVAANAMFALGQSGNPVSDDMGSAAITSFEDTPIAEGEHVSERAEQNTPEDSYSRGDCGIVLSEPVSMPIEDSGFIQNPSAGSHTQDPVADPQHYEASPRNDEQVFSGKDHGPSPSGDENAAERLDQNGDEHLQLSTSNEPPDNQISEENNEILLSEPVSMAMEESSSGVQHESDDMGQSGSIIEEAGCGLLLSDPVSMSVDCHTDIPTLVSDTDAQDISPQPHVDVDETPALEISNITGSTRNCDVSGLLPAKFVSKCRENGVAKLLLECSKSSASFIGLSSLTDLVSVQSSAWEEAGGKSRVAIGKDCRAPARILVQRRLGYVPVADGHGLDTPKGFDDAALNICANHRQLLISAFPLDRCCGACRKGVDVASDADVHVISVSMSERFTRFLPDLVAGQPLCGTCHKGLVISIKAGKREFRTEASMANQLKQYQLIHEDNYKSVLDSCRERFGMSLKKRWSEDGAKNNEYSKTLFPLQDWVIFNDSRAPFDTSASKVPPLRWVICSYKLLISILKVLLALQILGSHQMPPIPGDMPARHDREGVHRADCLCQELLLGDHFYSLHFTLAHVSRVRASFQKDINAGDRRADAVLGLNRQCLRLPQRVHVPWGVGVRRGGGGRGKSDRHRGETLHVSISQSCGCFVLPRRLWEGR